MYNTFAYNTVPYNSLIQRLASLVVRRAIYISQSDSRASLSQDDRRIAVSNNTNRTYL